MTNDNDPTLNGKYLGSITQDFVIVSDTLKEAAYQVRKQGFSEYPIFPIAKTARSHWTTTDCPGRISDPLELLYYLSG